MLLESTRRAFHIPYGLPRNQVAKPVCDPGRCTPDSVIPFRMTNMTSRLKAARISKGTRNIDLLICDEWGYVPLDREGAQLLFQVISDCYERRSVIITTNLEFSRWGNIFCDEQMTVAIIDRLIHHSYLLIFDGQSYRMRQSLMNMKQLE